MGILNFILTFLLGIFIWKFLPSYFDKKAKNLATKEDMKEIETIKNQVSHIYNARSSHEIEFRAKRIESYEEIVSVLNELMEISVKLINSREVANFKEYSNLFRGKMYFLYSLLFKRILYFRQEEYEMLMAYRWFYDNYELEKMSFSNDYNIAIVYNVFLNLLRNSFIKIYIEGFEKIMIGDCVSNRQLEPEIEKYKDLISQERIIDRIKARYSSLLKQYEIFSQELLINFRYKMDVQDNKITFIE